MAPEILLALPYGTAVDIYSFGILFYELIFGKTEWTETPRNLCLYTPHRLTITCKGGQLVNLCKRVIEGERPQFPTDREVPALWKNLIEQCWIAMPESRPSATALLKYFPVRK